jgi:hypothetical protein
VVRFVLIGVQAAFGKLAAHRGGVLLGALVIGGLVLYVDEHGAEAARRRAATPFALAVGAVLFLVLTGTVRSGQGGGAFRQLVGPEHARQSRYVYLVAAMLLPAVALACEAVIRRWRYAAVFVAVLLIAGLPRNVDGFRTYGSAAISSVNKFVVLAAPKLPLAAQLPRTLRVSFYGGGPTLGWLMAASRSGDLPAPPPSTPDELATETATLALRPWSAPPLQHCSTLDEAGLRVLQKGELLTVKAGSVSITYLAPNGGRSHAKRFGRVTLRALAGPLKLLIAPGRTRRGSNTLCS